MQKVMGTQRKDRPGLKFSRHGERVFLTKEPIRQIHGDKKDFTHRGSTEVSKQGNDIMGIVLIKANARTLI